MFESLSERISGIIKKLKGRGKLTEEDVQAALREVRRALLEADVSLPVVRDFVNDVRNRAVGEELWKSLTPGQLVVKHVRDALIELMGGEAARLEIASSPPTVIMLVGLNGSGKTTTAGKLALHLKKAGHRPLIAATDVYRPAAIQQLEVLGRQLDVPVFQMGDSTSPVHISRSAVKHAESQGHDVVIVDTAGRLHVNQELMDELAETRDELHPHEVLLVVDAMTGQDAVTMAQTFSDQIGLTGIIMTKLDGDARGGAALSVRRVTGKPIKFIGTGEKPTALEPFHPDRMAGRILGMGDVLGLIEKAEQAMDEDQAAELERKFREDSFNLEDFLEQLQQVRKLGPIGDLLKMLPGVGNNPQLRDLQVDEKQFRRIEAIIQSMTPEERRDPDLLNASRKRRVAKGCGSDVSDINRLLKHYTMMKKMMRSLTGQVSKKGRRKKGKGKGMGIPFRLPF
ncbi:MAG: signal recognition particle protein [Armatimonadetes bacterium]|nr:signal recognition particle protein [Armatimonadota bacterium]